MAVEFIFTPNRFALRQLRRYLPDTTMSTRLKVPIMKSQLKRSLQAIEMSRIPRTRLEAPSRVSAAGRSQQAW
jgi:hypothetical protein